MSAQRVHVDRLIDVLERLAASRAAREQLHRDAIARAATQPPATPGGADRKEPPP